MNDNTQKEEYIKLINNSPIYTTDKEVDYNLYLDERSQLITLIYNYYKIFISLEFVNKYGYELVCSVDECLKYYNLSKGPFLNYFSIVFKNEYKKSNAKEIENTIRSGVHISQEKSKIISKICKYIQSNNFKDIQEEQLQLISKAFNIEKSRIVELLELNDKLKAMNSVIKTDEEELNLLDMYKVEDNRIKDIDSYDYIFEKIEETFNCQQNRVERNEIISILITLEIYSEFGTKIPLLNYDYSFINKDIIKYCEEKGRIPTNKEIAQKYHKQEQSISRTLAQFKAQLKEKLNI